MIRIPLKQAPSCTVWLELHCTIVANASTTGDVNLQEWPESICVSSRYCHLLWHDAKLCVRGDTHTYPWTWAEISTTARWIYTYRKQCLTFPKQSDGKTQSVFCESVRTLTGSLTSSPTVIALIMQERFGSFYLSSENHWFRNTLA